MVLADRAADRMNGVFESSTPEETFEIGERLGALLEPGDVLMLRGGLGAGKTLLTKGILNALEFDIDDVTSPSFTLVNYYETPELDVYHIDLWRLDETADVVASVGLDEILSEGTSVVIIEWSEKLRHLSYEGRIIAIEIEGDGDDPRIIRIELPRSVSRLSKKLDAEELRDPRLVVRKSERLLELYDGGRLVRTFPMVLGFEPEGEKRTEGDGRTPVGEYSVCVKNSESKFHLSLGLNYPGVGDAERGLREGLITREEHEAIVLAISKGRIPPQKTRLGGEIYIHGGGTAQDWTEGCVALDDADIAELFEAINVGTPVSIVP